MIKRQRAKPNTPEKYLWPKRGARHLWFRYSVPVRYRAIEGRAIIQRSTGTNDRRQASITAARWRSELHARWEAEAGEITSDRPSALVEPTSLEMKSAAADAAFVQVRGKLDDLQRSKQIKSNADYQVFVQGLKDQLTRLLRTKESGSLYLWERVADNQIAAHGWLLPKHSDQYSEFVSMIAEAGIEALRVTSERLQGNLGAEPSGSCLT